MFAMRRPLKLFEKMIYDLLTQEGKGITFINIPFKIAFLVEWCMREATHDQMNKRYKQQSIRPHVDSFTQRS